MNQEQKFDKIIKKKVDEAEFPFDEQNWNRLSAQLDAERALTAKRGWDKFLFLGLLFLGVTSASIALYKIQGPFGSKGELSNNTATSNNTTGLAHAHGAAGKNSFNTSDDNLLASNNTNSNAGVANYNNTSSVDNNLNSTALVTNSETNGSSNTANNSEATANTVTGNNSSALANKKATTVLSVNKNGKGSGKNSFAADKDATSKDADNNSMLSGERTKSDLAGGVDLEMTSMNRIDAKLNIVNSQRNVKLGALKIPAWYDEDYRRKGKKRISFLNAEAGVAYLFGWDSKEGKDGKGFNWYAGLNYGKFINKKIGFSVGSQFYNISNIKQPYYESSKAVYGLGSVSSNTIITTQALYYFNVPVKFYYSLGASHQIGAGVNPSFLFSSKNKIENYRLTDNIKSNEMESTSSGIYEGVRLNNILVSAFYKAKINKRMFVNAEVLYGVRDIFKNTNTNNYSQKPVALRVGLQYTLFEK